MKTSKNILALAAVMMVATNNCESIKNDDAVLPVEHIESEEVFSILDDKSHKSSALQDLFNECCDNDNAQACQQFMLITIAEKQVATALMCLQHDIIMAQNGLIAEQKEEIAAQRKNIAMYEGMIRNLNAREKRRCGRRAARKNAQEKRVEETTEQKQELRKDLGLEK